MYRHLKPVSRISSALKKKGTYSRRQQRGRSYPLHFSRSYPGITSLQQSSNDEDDSNATTIHHRHLVVRRSISSLSKEAATCAVDTPVGQRWWAVPPANAVHLAIGSVYVYSMWTPGMTHALGVVSASSLDWTHGQVLPVFSASAVCLGLTVRYVTSRHVTCSLRHLFVPHEFCLWRQCSYVRIVIVSSSISRRCVCFIDVSLYSLLIFMQIPTVLTSVLTTVVPRTSYVHRHPPWDRGSKRSVHGNQDLLAPPFGRQVS